MNTNQNIPKSQKHYGAIELKNAMPGNSAKGFSIAVSLFLLLFMGNLIFNYFSADMKAPEVNTGFTGRIEIMDNNFLNKPEPLPAIIHTKKLLAGIKEIIGKLVPVPDIDIIGELAEIATIDKLHLASSRPADEIIEAGLNPADMIFGSDGKDIKQAEEQYPDYNQFVPVEVNPQVDLTGLQRSIVYPELAIKAGVEGKVYVRVLIDKYGNAIESKVEHSDNQLLDDAAIDAVMGATFTPARQNGRPVSCWVTVPIVFALR